jgi:tetratricopeptide (TPR) repeat protein
MASDPSKVFISYSHDSLEHTRRVHALADRLRADGVEAWIDQYAQDPNEGWIRWMRSRVKQADRVLLIFTETYQRRFEGDEEEGKGLGATFEGVIVTQTLYESGGRNAKFRPVVFRQEDEQFIPLELRQFNRYGVDTEQNYKELLRWLHEAPRIVAPTVGQKPELPPERASELFSSGKREDKKPIHNLPFPPNPAFTGREAELKKLHEELQNRVDVAVTQTVAIHGLGGVGKTQLAVEYAWEFLDDYDAVLWVKGDSPEALDGGLAALASLLRLSESGERKQAVQTRAVLGWLHGHEHWLLIADNADTDEAVRALSDRLPPSLPGQVLITSRISNWPVNIQDLALDLLSPDAATRYLLKRVARRRHNAGDEAAARSLADELGDLPLALEQAASFIFEVKWTFEKYQKAFYEARLGGSDYPVSIAKTWSITLDQISPLGRVLLRLAAWFAPDLIPRGIFSAKKGVVSEALGEEVSDLAIDRALGELDRFSLVRLTSETVSVHRLLQAVEQDSLGEERKRWLVSAVRLFNVFAPGESWDVSTWGIWVSLNPHAESLLEHTNRYGVDMLPIALLADQFGSFLCARAAYGKAEPLYQRALAIREKELGLEHPDVAWTLNGLACLDMDLGRYAEAEPLLERALAIREKALGPEHRDLAETLYDSATLYCDQGQYAKAEPLYQRALVIWEKALGPKHPDVAWSLNGLARLYNAQGQYAKAEPLYQRALAIREKALDPAKHPDVAQSLNNLAELYRAQGQYVKAQPLYERALTIREKALGPDHPNVATSLNDLAGLYAEQGQYAKAEPLYQRALAIREKALGPNHLDMATSFNDLALLYNDQGRYEKAESLLKRAVAIRESALGPNHPDVATSLNNLGLLYHNQGQYSKAEPLFGRSLTIAERSFGLEHPDVANSLTNLAGLYKAQGQYAKAEPLSVQALAIKEKALGPDHSDVAASLNNLADLYAEQGQYAKAEPLCQRALAIWEQALGPQHPNVAASLSNMAHLYRDQGQYAKAEPLYQRALAIDENTLGPQHPNMANSLNNLAALYAEQGQYTKAEPLYQRALAIWEKALGVEHPNVATSLKNYALLLRKMDRSQEAEPLEARARAIRTKSG